MSEQLHSGSERSDGTGLIPGKLSANASFYQFSNDLNDGVIESHIEVQDEDKINRKIISEQRVREAKQKLNQMLNAEHQLVQNLNPLDFYNKQDLQIEQYIKCQEALLNQLDDLYGKEQEILRKSEFIKSKLELLTNRKSIDVQISDVQEKLQVALQEKNKMQHLKDKQVNMINNLPN